MIAYCGLECNTCPIFEMTREKDEKKKQQLREEIAEESTLIYGKKTFPEDITDCEGCTSDTGKLFGTCANCRIRQCANNRGLVSCAFCSDYSCKMLNDHFATDPDSKCTIEKIRRERKAQA